MNRISKVNCFAEKGFKQLFMTGKNHKESSNFFAKNSFFF